jgi:tetratricopeptide (TPR) repeat protein
MLALSAVAFFALYTIIHKQTVSDEITSDLSAKLSQRLDKLWVIAQDALKDRKYLRAEKALLMILRVDERNATAYNRLGILYAKQRAFNDAIECFEIAQSLEPSASSLHNVGLIYFETEHYEKAALAFEQALEIEDDLAARHIAYAKVQEKLGNDKKVIPALENAVKLEKTPQTLTLLADAYERTETKLDLAAKMRKHLSRMQQAQGTSHKVNQPRRAKV